MDYSLYLVTDRDLLKGRELTQVVEEAILGGVTLVQLREKEISSLDFYNTAIKVKSITDKYNIPLIINDRVDIALAVDASGVHVGQSDLSCSVVRRLLPKSKIVGVSVHNIQEAMKAEADGADYVGCGAIFSTTTKLDANNVTIEQLTKIKKTISIPVVAIGGISENNIEQLKNSNIDGVAIVSAIIAKEDPRNASKIIKTKFFYD